jgi:hypothetical protein
MSHAGPSIASFGKMTSGRFVLLGETDGPNNTLKADAQAA